MTIDKQNIVNAADVRGWNICLWGNPLLKIFCGISKPSIVTATNP